MFKLNGTNKGMGYRKSLWIELPYLHHCVKGPDLQRECNKFTSSFLKSEFVDFIAYRRNVLLYLSHTFNYKNWGFH